MANTEFVKCGLEKGFFEEEVYVLVGASSAIVNRQEVRVINEPKRGTQGQGEVCVYIVERTPDRILVELPGLPVVGGLRTWVPATDLAAA